MNKESVLASIPTRSTAFLPALAFVASTVGAVVPAHAVFIGNIQGGTDFPQGAISFADSVIDYSVGTGGVTAPNQGSANALGVPDYAASIDCVDQLSCPYVSLGSGGSITLQFTDNFLTGSGDSSFDLWIFEVGPDVEDTFVEISKDGVTWSSVGKVLGDTAGIDIDSFGFDATDLFSYVRLTDDVAEGGTTGPTAGADIDAVGAISTIARSVPEPATLILLTAGLAGIGWSRKTARH